MSGPYNNRNRGRGGNRPSYNQNNKRRTHDYQQQVQQHQQQSSSINNSQELNNGVYANERFMHTTMALIGAIAKVTVRSGKIYEGVFKTSSPQFELVLDRVHEVDPSNPGNIPFREEIRSQMVFKLDDIASVLYTNVDPYFAIADGFTDAAISRKTNGQAMEKELQPWVSDLTSEEVADDTDLLEAGKSNGWDAMDMFRTNRDKFQIESTYDPNMGQYTTPLPTHNTDDFKMYEENAAVMAREIEASLAYKQRIELENTKDEETLHSAVAREAQAGSGKNQQRQRQDGGQYGDRTGHCGPRINKSYTSSSISSQSSLRENSPLSRQQSLKAASQSVQSVADLSSTPLGNYSDVVAKKHLTGGSGHGHQGHHPTTSHLDKSTFSSHNQSSSQTSNPSGNTPVTNVNGFKHHNVPEQAPVPSNEWKDSKTHHSSTVGAGSYGGSGGHQQQSGEVGGSHHHHFQPPAYHKDVTIAEKIKDLREFQVNFNLTDMPHNQSTSQQQQQQPAVQNVISSVESQHVQTPSSTIQTSSECGATISSNTPTSSKTPTLSSGLLAADSEGSIEKKKEVTYTLNPNANEFRPRNTPSVSLEPGMGQILHPMVPAASLLPQQSTTQAHLQSLKPAHMANNQIGSQQTQQLVPSTVASPPILNPYPTGIQQFAMAPHPPIFYCQQPMTPRYSGGTKRATVSARGNNEVGTPQATNIMAGAPLISQNGLPAHMFVTPQQMLSPYNSLRLMTPCPVILEHVPHNPMLLSASMINPLAAPPHGTPTAVMHPLLQQQQILAQQPQQQSNSSNGRPNSNGSGAPTPVHYQPGHPMQAQNHSQAVAHHQQQQTPTQIYHGTPTASLSLQVHPQQIPSGSQMPNSMQSQMIFSPFIPTFPNHHPQSGGFTAAMPPPAISGTLQGQVPPGSALHHHHLVQHQFQPLIIASQNQQVAAAAQLGQFVAVPGLTGVPQGPPNIASPLLYGMPPTIQPSMAGQNFQHGQ